MHVHTLISLAQSVNYTHYMSRYAKQDVSCIDKGNRFNFNQKWDTILQGKKKEKHSFNWVPTWLLKCIAIIGCRAAYKNMLSFSLPPPLFFPMVENCTHVLERFVLSLKLEHGFGFCIASVMYPNHQGPPCLPLMHHMHITATLIRCAKCNSFQPEPFCASSRDSNITYFCITYIRLRKWKSNWFILWSVYGCLYLQKRVLNIPPPKNHPKHLFRCNLFQISDERTFCACTCMS